MTAGGLCSWERTHIPSCSILFWGFTDRKQYHNRANPQNRSGSVLTKKVSSGHQNDIQRALHWGTTGLHLHQLFGS